MNVFTALVICLITAAAVGAQIENPHARNMERAHPTPVISPVYQAMPVMIPLVTETTLPSLFLNSIMIEAENDPLPAQNESSIAVNPLNPSNLIGSAVDYRASSSTWVYYSTDEGRSWKNINLGTARAGWTSSNDPSVCFDHRGKGYLTYGGFKREGNVQFGENGIFVSSTTDGGKTWAMKHTAVIIHTGKQTADSAFEDKYYIHADTAATSPHRGDLYIPWKRVINRDSSTQIVIVKSTDQGATWSAPVNVSSRFVGTSEDTTFGQSFPLARTGPDGFVHLVWNSGTEDALRYAQSTDGGATWTNPRIIHTYRPFGIKSTINGQTNSRVKTVVRAECYPTLAIDNTRGTRNGWLYLTWAADNYPNVYFSRSTDNGGTWAAARIVHSDTTNDQFWSWIALDPRSGELAIMYSDSRDDTANILVNTYVSWSSDGGTTWADQRVGDGLNDLRRNPFQGNTFAGDYSGCDFYNGKIYPSWVDMRNTYINPADNDVYTAVVNSRAPRAPSFFTATTIATRKTEIDLSWSAISSLSFGQPLPSSGVRWIVSRDGVPIDTLAIAITSMTDRGLITYRRYAYTIVATTPTDTSASREASAYAGGASELQPPVLYSVKGAPTNELVMDILLPRLRLDSVTPIVNLAGVRTFASEQQFSHPVLTSDTGKRVSFSETVSSNGWYHVHTSALDSEGNSSPPSDTIIAYTGTVGHTTIPFGSDPHFWVINGAWGATTNFYRSAPASYAHSPVGPYQPTRRDTVNLYPYRTVVPGGGGNVLRMSYFVAAFVDPSDTMFLETSYKSIAGPWTTRSWWNSSKDSRWADTTKGDDAWRAEYVDLTDYNSDSMFIRLRFRSNASQQSDGFYIDDIAFSTVTSVDLDPSSIIEVLYPNPVTSHANISLRSDDLLSSCVAIDGSGISHSVSWTQHGRTLIADLRYLPQGVYTLVVARSTSVEHVRLVVIR